MTARHRRNIARYANQQNNGQWPSWLSKTVAPALRNTWKWYQPNLSQFALFVYLFKQGNWRHKTLKMYNMTKIAIIRDTCILLFAIQFYYNLRSWNKELVVASNLLKTWKSRQTIFVLSKFLIFLFVIHSFIQKLAR